MSIDNVLRNALSRKLSPQELAVEVTLIYRPDNRGPYAYKKSREDPRNFPGWWAIDGLANLWVLKAMEEFGIIRKSLKVNKTLKIFEF